MEETILNAIESTEKPKKVRQAGFTPGVLYGGGNTAAKVKFESSALNKILTRHGHNAKLWVNIDANKNFGFVREVQKHPVEGKVIHIAIQLISQDQEVKMQIPITFQGRDELEKRMLTLQVSKSEIAVFGKANLIPDAVVVDVSNMELEDNITMKDFDLDPQIKVQDFEDEIYATIKEVYEEQPEEEPAETEEE